MTQALGVDVGGVIIDRVGDKKAEKGFYSDDCTSATEIPLALSALRLLGKMFFGESVYIISKCSHEAEERTLRWMRHHRFFERTGITPDRIHFCRTRAGKAPICERLGITHFVDDRAEVLSYLHTVRHRFLLNPQQEELKRFLRHLPDVVTAKSWEELVARIIQRTEIPER